MKIRTFLCLCLLTVIALTQLSAQNSKKSEVTKTFVYKDIDYGYWAPIYCKDILGNDILVDELCGTIKVKFVIHVEEGIEKWEILIWKGELTSALNDEVFQIHESDKIGIPNTGVYTYHFNLVGNMGSHYINSGTLNMDDWSIDIEKIACPGN